MEFDENKDTTPTIGALTEVEDRVAVQRLRLLQEKKEAQAKATRREIAVLIEQQKIEKARIKVESIIHEGIHVELLELLELYCELLLARFGLLELSTQEPDPGVSEGVCAIIHAAPRTELKELHVLRDMLMHKFGRTFSAKVMENEDGCVSERVARKIAFTTPPEDLVNRYMVEIAKGYGVPYSAFSDEGDGDNGEGGLKETTDLPLENPNAIAEKIAADEKLPSLPSIETAGDDKGALAKREAPMAKADSKAQEDEFAALAKRFEALKKK